LRIDLGNALIKPAGCLLDTLNGFDPAIKIAATLTQLHVELRHGSRQLACLAPGLLMFSMNNILARAFYALDDIKTPMKISLLCLGLNLVFAFWLVQRYREAGLGVANTLSATLNLALLVYALRRKLSRLGLAGVVNTLLVLVPALAAQAAEAATPARKPNILIILADDLGYADLGCQGSAEVKSPEIDSLAVHGVRCTAAYVSAPQCCPSRAGLITGRYQNRFGFEANWPAGFSGRAGLPAGETTIADRLKAAGYVTGYTDVIPTTGSLAPVRLTVRVRPGASRTRVGGRYGDGPGGPESVSAATTSRVSLRLPT